VDAVNQVVHLRFTDLDLEWCEGRVPTPSGPVGLHWRKDGQTLHYRVSVPAGYTVTVNNASQLELLRAP
jgi:alpha-L-rhamnosidase